jgi:CRP-like cAMP-binding protein
VLSSQQLPGTTGNFILDALRPADRARLLAHARRTDLQAKEVLAEPGRIVSRVYFPIGSIVSLINVMSDGSAMETFMVGREGMVGLCVFLGNGAAPNVRAVVHVPGEALSVDAMEFERQANGWGMLRTTLYAYTNALLVEAAQEIACARLHPLEARLSRCLLMMQDRAGTPEFSLTQELLSEMLGVHRPSLTVAALSLQKEGLISYRRGHVRIVDQPGLMEAACECYPVITAAFEDLVGAARSNDSRASVISLTDPAGAGR